MTYYCCSPSWHNHAQLSRKDELYEYGSIGTNYQHKTWLKNTNIVTVDGAAIKIIKHFICVHVTFLWQT